ncbi:hypothetical protein KKA02_03800 [Patescibacteria group bacterium]|nr:hypothetical protein [Patescibacteria group bacterium]
MPSQTYSNQDIANILQNIATAYQIKKKNKFRITAYQNASESVRVYPKNVQKLWQKDKKLLDEIPDIGPAILKKLDYLFNYHKLHPHIIKAFKNIHPATFIFTQINGIGPKTAHKLTQKFKFPKNPIKALKKLIYYAQKEKIRNLDKFGQKSEQLILANTQDFLSRQKQMTYKKASKISKQIIGYLKKEFPQTEFYPLGSLRRQSKKIGDIDIAAKSNKKQQILNAFVKYPKSLKTIYKGNKKASIKLAHDIHIDLMVQPPQKFGSLLQHFTGSRQHNILLRRYALKLGYSLSEYGIKNLKTGKVYSFNDEKKFYNFLKLDYIEAKNRVGKDEIESAKKNYNKCYTK